MEIEKQKSKGTLVVIIILTLIIVGLGGYIAYDKGMFGAKKESSNQTSVETRQEETTKVEEKVVEKSEPTDNSYQLWASNLKKEYETKFAPKTYTSSQLFVNSSVIKDGYTVYLNGKGELSITYWNKKYNSKYNEYIIASNVLNYAVVTYGQGGGNQLYFINEDGTVGEADTEYGMLEKEKLDVKKDIGLKNIISIIGGSFGTEHGLGTTGPIFIDINGKLANIDK